jgi:hypothetical protein
MGNDIKMKLARKLVKSLSVNSGDEDMFEALRNNFSQVMNENEIERMFLNFKKNYSPDHIIDDIADLYCQNFTEDEMIDYVNFFNTASGKKWVSKYPVIVSEIVKISEDYGIRIAEKIMKNLGK